MRIGVTLGILAAAVAGCAASIDGSARYAGGVAGADAPLVKITQLAEAIPAPRDIGALLGAPGLRPLAAYTKPDALPPGSISDENCVSVMTPAEESFYRGSGSRGVFGRVDGDTGARRTSVAAAAFDSPDAAHDFVTSTVQNWRECAGKTLTVSLIGPKVSWQANAPSRSNGADVMVRTQNEGRGYACGRSIASWSNAVADVLVCSPDGTVVAEQAAAVADLVLGGLPR